MKKIFTIVVLFFALSFASFAQTVLLQNDFAGYIGTPSTVAPGWYYSANDSGTTKSYYTSTGNYGNAAPSYKFGHDSVTMITPRIIGSPDSVNFWMKGNGSSTSLFSLQNTFSIFESTDSTTWTLNTAIDSLVANVTSGSTDSMRVTLMLNPATAFLKFYYHKVVGNVAFDDVLVFGTITGVQTPKNNALSPVVYPNPSKGLVNINFRSSQLKNATVLLSDLLGNDLKKVSCKNTDSVYQLDLSEFQDGIYFVKIKSDAGESVQRIILKK